MELHRLRCASCHRCVAYSVDNYALKTKAYCSPLCAMELPAVEESERNDQWEMLAFSGRTPVTIARMYGSPHGLVYKTLKRLTTTHAA